MPIPEYAIAGNYEQLKRWKHEDWESRSQVVYLHNEASCRGRPGGIVHRVGEWWNSPIANYVGCMEKRETSCP